MPFFFQYHTQLIALKEYKQKNFTKVYIVVVYSIHFKYVFLTYNDQLYIFLTFEMMGERINFLSELISLSNYLLQRNSSCQPTNFSNVIISELCLFGNVNTFFQRKMLYQVIISLVKQFCQINNFNKSLIIANAKLLH